MNTPNPKNPDTTITAGDSVKSFDFPDHYRFNVADEVGDCFVQGIVEGVKMIEGCDRYVIKVYRRVFGGKECDEFEDYVYPPVNGTDQMFSPVPTFGVVKS